MTVPQLGSVYKFDAPGLDDEDLNEDDYGLLEVVGVNRHEFDPDNTTVELDPVGDLGNWCTQYLDNFWSGYTKVADSVEDLDGVTDARNL